MDLSTSSDSSDSSSSDSSSSYGCDGKPDVIVSVTGSPGDFPITWCGKTWVASGATGDQLNNGEEATICPTSYTLRQYTSTYTLTGAEGWGASGLAMGRFFDGGINDSAHVAVSLINFVSYKMWAGSPYFTYVNAELNSPPSAIAGGKPSNGDYRITDDLFGSATSGTVTYSWRRGSNW